MRSDGGGREDEGSPEISVSIELTHSFSIFTHTEDTVVTLHPEH